MEKQDLKIGDELITSKGLFGKVTRIEGDRIYVKLGSKEIPIFRNQLTISVGVTPLHITYTIVGDDTEYPALMLLPKHTIICDKDVDLKSMCLNHLFNNTGKQCVIVKVSIA